MKQGNDRAIFFEGFFYFFISSQKVWLQGKYILRGKVMSVGG